jgi:hypothetical protein
MLERGGDFRAKQSVQKNSNLFTLKLLRRKNEDYQETTKDTEEREGTNYD